MRVTHVFGQHIDLAPIVQISEWFLPEPDSMEFTNWLDFASSGPWDRVLVCEIVYQLRDEPVRLLAAWPSHRSVVNWQDEEEKAAYVARRSEAYASIRADYDRFIAEWVDSRES